MIIQHNYHISDKMSDGLNAALSFINDSLASKDSEDVFDLKGVSFTPPMFLMPIQIFRQNTTKSLSFAGISDYLNHLYFVQGGLDSERHRLTEFAAIMEAYASKTYIPLIRFNAEVNQSQQKDKILESLYTIIIRQTGVNKDLAEAIRFMISEITDNITEHADTANGFIVAQAYPNKQFMDVCIGDAGISLLGSYKEAGSLDVDTDIKAMEKVILGISTKNYSEFDSRGFGIISTRKLLMKGLNGQFVMMSGNAIYYENSDTYGYLQIPDNLRLGGTLVALRIPYKVKGFNFFDYIV